MDDGVSDTLGAVILVAVVAMAISLIGVTLFSQPNADRIPALSADITVSDSTIRLRHAGGDPIAKSDLKVLVDGSDLTGSFSMNGGGSWSAWSIGDTLTYKVPGGQSLPKYIEIVYTGIPGGNVLQSWGVPSR
jgi:FlaG/FlaF family flagellin (archaellin)